MACNMQVREKKVGKHLITNTFELFKQVCTLAKIKAMYKLCYLLANWFVVFVLLWAHNYKKAHMLEKLPNKHKRNFPKHGSVPKLFFQVSNILLQYLKVNLL